MTSAANNQGFGPNWSNPNWGPGSADQRGPWGGHYWGFLPPWLPPPAAKGLLIAAMIFGFVFCWPIGLVLLGVLIWSRRACGWHYGAWQARGPAGGGTGPWRGGWQRWGAAGGGTPPSSGNRAFDEYRAETLKRLEDEQKEFARISRPAALRQGQGRVRPVHERAAQSPGRAAARAGATAAGLGLGPAGFPISATKPRGSTRKTAPAATARAPSHFQP